MTTRQFPQQQRGTTLIEILVTMVILSFGLLGIAVFHVKSQVASLESYQRAQAVILLEDMHARMSVNPDQSALYLTPEGESLGTGSEGADCRTLAAGSERDKCEWNNALLGAAESHKGDVKVGSMIGARGCIEQVQQLIETGAGCQPGVYLITVAWQGMHATRKPSQSCGSGEYGAESAGLRRAMSSRVSTAAPGC